MLPVNTLKTAQRAVSQPSRRAISFEVVDEQTLADMFKVGQASTRAGCRPVVFSLTRIPM